MVSIAALTHCACGRIANPHWILPIARFTRGLEIADDLQGATTQPAKSTVAKIVIVNLLMNCIRFSGQLQP